MEEQNKIVTTVELNTQQAEQELVKMNSAASNSTKTLEERIIAKNKAIEIQNELSKRTIATLEAERRVVEGRGYTEKDLMSVFLRLNKAKLDAIKISEQNKVQLDKLVKSEKEEEQTIIKLAGAFAKLNKERGEAKTRLRDLIAAEDSSTKEIKKAQKEYDILNSKVNKANAAVGSLQSTFSGNRFGLAVNGIKGLVAAFGVTTGIYLFTGLIKDAFKTIKEFDGASADLAATLGVSRSEIKKLTDNAKELGEITKFTATEIVGLQKELGKLGFSETEILQSTGAITELAAAVETDLGTAAALTGRTLRAFGLDASEMQRVVDVMSKSFVATALDVSDFTESMKYVAPIARQLNVSIEETTSLLGILADNGIKGSMAGTSLKRIMTDIAATGKPFNEALKEVTKNGISVKDSMDLVGRNAQAALLVLSKNIPKVNELTEALDNAAGATRRMAEEQLDSLPGKITLLTSAWDGFILSLSTAETKSGGVSGFLGSFADSLTNIINLLSQLTKNEKQLENSFKNIGKQKGISEYQAIMQNISKTSKENIENTKKELLARERENIRVNQAIIKAEKEKRESIIGGDRALFHLQTKIEEDALVQLGKSAEKIKQIKLSTQPKVGGGSVTQQDTYESDEDRKKRLKAEKKSEKEVNDRRRREAKAQIDLAQLEVDKRNLKLKNDPNRDPNEDTFESEKKILKMKTEYELMQLNLLESEKSAIRKKYQVEEDELLIKSEKDRENRLFERSKTQIELDEIELQRKRSVGESTLALELEFLDRKRDQELTALQLSEEQKKVIEDNYRQQRADAIEESRVIAAENQIAIDEQDLIAAELRNKNVYGMEKALREKARALELSDLTLTQEQKKIINKKYDNANTKSKKEAIEIDLANAGEAFGISKEIKMAEMIMAAPTAIGNSFQKASEVYAPPLSLAMGAAGAAAVVVPIIQGLNDIKKTRFPGKKSSKGESNRSISSGTGVSQASVGDLTANNIAQLGVDPSLRSSATSDAANSVVGGRSNRLVFSEGRYSDFKNQVDFKEQKSTI